MAEKEQAKPLAPAAHQISINDDETFSVDSNHHHHRKYIKWFGCIVALLLVKAVIILVLFCTAFHVKDPVLKLNSVKISGLDCASNATFRPGSKLTLVASVFLKNPNLGMFTISNATISFFNGGGVVGEGRDFRGVAEAQGTLLMKLTLDVMARRLRGDLSFGVFHLSSYTRIGGRVKILKIIKRNVVVKMHCTMVVNITSQGIQDKICNQSV